VAAAQAVRRILVAIDPSPHGRATLEEAVALAVRLDAELVGLFVEDENLLRWAQLPFAREFGALYASGRALDVASVERMLRAQAAVMRRELERHASTSRLKWSFRVARGSIASQVIAAGEEADLIVVGRGEESAKRSRVGSTARAVLTRSRCAVWCTRSRSRAGRTIVVVYEGTDASSRAMRTALDLARTNEDPVVVLIADGDREADLEARAKAALGHLAPKVRLVGLQDASSSSVSEAAAGHDARVIVLGEGALGSSPESVHEIVEAIDRPVVIVR
jgi:nucleotide-binding universal stress UspA family protein